MKLYGHLLLITLLTIGLHALSFGQIFEPFNQRYIYLPSANVAKADNDAFDNTERGDIHLWETIARFPVKLGKAFLIPEFTYKNYVQSYQFWPQEQVRPRRTDHFRIFLKGIFPTGNGWSVLGVGGVAQGLNQDVSFDIGNNFFRVGMGVLKTFKSGNRLGMTILYVSENKIVVPIPSYKGASKNGKWQFDIEGPTAVIERIISDNNRIRFQNKLDNDRISYIDEVSQIADTYNYTHLNLSVGWSRRIIGPLFANVSGGLTPLHLLTLYDSDNESFETLRFEMQPTISFALYVTVNPQDYLKK